MILTLNAFQTDLQKDDPSFQKLSDIFERNKLNLVGTLLILQFGTNFSYDLILYQSIFVVLLKNNVIFSPGLM